MSLSGTVTMLRFTFSASFMQNLTVQNALNSYFQFIPIDFSNHSVVCIIGKKKCQDVIFIELCCAVDLPNLKIRW